MGESMKKIAIVLLAALMLLAISCDEKPQHEHKFSEEWKSNETQHWHECECQEKSGVAEHDYETITVESTCSKKGSETVKCKVCGYVKSTKELELKAHTQAEEHVIVKATCSEFGSDSTVCSVCGGTISTTYSAKTDHTSGAPQDIKTATCSEEGLSVVKCTVCDEVISSTPIACDAHTWEWSTVAESGLKTRTCSVCYATETSGSEIIKETAFGAAMNYDGLIYNVEEGKTEAVVEMVSEGSVFSSSDNLVYDFKNASMDFEGSYKFEIKVHHENDYHTVSFALPRYYIFFKWKFCSIITHDGISVDAFQIRFSFFDIIPMDGFRSAKSKSKFCHRFISIFKIDMNRNYSTMCHRIIDFSCSVTVLKELFRLGFIFSHL